jgi:hypothetical protein
MGRVKRLFVYAAGLLFAATAGAQDPQYISPGTLALPTATTEQSLLKAMGDAPWRLGTLRVQPWIGLRDIAWVDNVFGSQNPNNQVDDLTITAGAGLLAYQPVGDKVILGAFALPEYTWWQDTDELSTWHYRYGAGIFGYFNRLQLELKGKASAQQSYISSELVRPEEIRRQGGEGLIEVDITGPFSFIIGGSTYSYDLGEGPRETALNADLDVLDRDETELRGGIKYSTGDHFVVTAGAARSEVSFDSTRDRSNSGTSPFATLHLAGSRLTADADLVYRDLSREQGSIFVDHSSLDGHGSLTLKPAGQLIYAVYGGRNMVYSLTPNTSWFDAERVGGSIEAHLGYRASLRGFYEFGQDDYQSVVGFVHRFDDYTGYGGDFQFRFTDKIILLLGVSKMEFDSNLPGFDRDVTVLRTRLNFGGDAAPF